MSRSTANPGMRLVTPASFLDVVRGPWRHLLGEGNVTLSFQRDGVWHVSTRARGRVRLRGSHLSLQK